MNSVSLMGRLVRDPELRYTQTGQALARFSLAIDRKLSREKRQEAESKGQPTADFINITAWGKQAEFCANYLEKGNRAIVQGSIQTGSYTDKDGKRVYTTDIWASSIEPIDWKGSFSSGGNRNASGYESNDNNFGSGFGDGFDQSQETNNVKSGDSNFNDILSDDDDIPF